MNEEFNIPKTEEESKIDSTLLLDWVSKNSYENLVEVKERLRDVNISYSNDGCAYNPDNETLYLAEDINTHKLNHELVHLISHRNRGQDDERTGIQTDMFTVSPNEALTELSTLVITKGASYIQSTEFSQLIQEYRATNYSEPGYLYATEYLIKRIKERNLDENKINHLISVYLFKEGSAESITEEIEEILKIENIEKGIDEYQKEKGYELLGAVWEEFKKNQRVEKWDGTVVNLNSRNITLNELFKPFDLAIELRYLRVFWGINKNRENFKKDIDKLVGVDSELSINMSLLYFFMRSRNDPEVAKMMQKYIVGKSMKLYRSVNNISN